MLTLTSARAAFLAYQHTRALTGAVDHLSRYLLPLLREWSVADAPLARSLERLGSRADAVLPALDFLLEWCSDKGSAVQSTLFHARDTLHRVEHFLAALSGGTSAVTAAAAIGGGVKSRGGGSAWSALSSESDREALRAQIDEHARELDCALSSLALAIEVINAAAVHKPQLPLGALIAPSSSVGGGVAQSARPDPPRYISPSCLLRASECMRSMSGGSGDLFVIQGSFYVQSAPDRSKTFSEAIRRAQETPASTHATADLPRWNVAMSPVADIHQAASSTAIDPLCEDEGAVGAALSALSSPSSTLASANPRILVTSEGGVDLDVPVARWIESGPQEIRVGTVELDADGWNNISPAPHQPMESMAVPLPIPVFRSPRSATATGSAATAAAGAAASPASARSLPPLPIPSPALPLCSNGLTAWKQLHKQASMKIVRNAARGLYELHITDLERSSSDQLSRPSLSTRKFDLSASLDFRATSSALLELREDASARRGGSALVDAVFSFEERIANSLQARYAFMMHTIDAPGEGASSSAAAVDGFVEKDAVRPLDLAYLARLCMYENLHVDHSSTMAMQAKRSVNLGSGSQATLAHTRASDEEIWLLLAGVHIPTPVEPMPPASAAASMAAPSAASPAFLSVSAAPAPSPASSSCSTASRSSPAAGLRLRRRDVPDFRVARHTSRLEPIVEFYTALGLKQLGSFEGHAGYDGVFLGIEGAPWHLEFTADSATKDASSDGADASASPAPRRGSPHPDDLLVLYCASQSVLDGICTRLFGLGLAPVSEPANPYWQDHGRVFLDPDGCGVALTLDQWGSE